LLDEASKEDKPDESPEQKIQSTSSRRILADGTYATETAFSSNSSAMAKLEAVKSATKPPLRGGQ